MSQTLLEKTAEQIAETTRQASRATDAIGHAIEDGVGVMRRAVKQGGDAAEEFLDDTTKRLERHLILTVVATLAIGLFSGAVFGWMVKRR